MNMNFQSETSKNTGKTKWQLVIGEENEHCACAGIIVRGENTISYKNYKAGQIVYLRNNTLQILVPWDGGIMPYEVNLDRSDELDWLKHLSRKTWATEDMIRAVASAARRLGRIKINSVKKSIYNDCWSKDREEEAVRRRHCEEEADKVWEAKRREVLGDADEDGLVSLGDLDKVGEAFKAELAEAEAGKEAE